MRGIFIALAFLTIIGVPYVKGAEVLEFNNQLTRIGGVQLGLTTFKEIQSKLGKPANLKSDQNEVANFLYVCYRIRNGTDFWSLTFEGPAETENRLDQSIVHTAIFERLPSRSKCSMTNDAPELRHFVDSRLLLRTSILSAISHEFDTRGAQTIYIDRTFSAEKNSRKRTRSARAGVESSTNYLLHFEKDNLVSATISKWGS
jgi:hypothetical protein